MSFHAATRYPPGDARYTKEPYIDGGPITDATRVQDDVDFDRIWEEDEGEPETMAEFSADWVWPSVLPAAVVVPGHGSYTQSADPVECPSCGSDDPAGAWYAPGATGQPVTCADGWHDEDATGPGDEPRQLGQSFGYAPPEHSTPFIAGTTGQGKSILMANLFRQYATPEEFGQAGQYPCDGDECQVCHPELSTDSPPARWYQRAWAWMKVWL